MTFHNVEQNTDEWLALRAGKITGSAISCAMANYGKAFGDPAKKYAIRIAIEQITGKRVEGGFSNEHTERGHEQEPIARMLYEDEYFCKVLNGGFYELDDEGCSPDGLVGEHGVIEIKCLIPSVFYSVVKRGSFDPKYKWQLSENLKITGRDWIDFICYCSEYPQGSRLYVYRCTKEMFSEEFKMIDIRLDEFKKLIEESKNNILNSNYSIIKGS